ncbi:efflux transporter outer membrane subunit [Geobacter sp. AOG2]|uniref:efflux transporter outer membrane subunit n=1 Tax=Geobacter sp. AOG2 TaxID=1566347 RepID=UPI001CC51BF5|nr:efflux transporter outer membrane subunit [Geobacter sp. AOG2]GFE60960.1 RND transporter [Geobacter sp. AOG2]
MIDRQSRYRRCRFLAGALMLLTGCTVGPNYVRPVAVPVMPASYKEVNGWKPAQPGDEAIKGEWWRIFNDPLLNRLEGQVALSNQNILAAEAAFRQASALIQEAKAGYYPTVSAGASVARTHQSGTIGTSAKTTTSYTLPVDISWEIDIWGRVRRSVEASRASAQASAADLAALRLSSQAQLAEAYFELRMQDSQKEFLDASVSYYQKTLELTRNRYAGGVAAKSDVLQAETQLKSTQAQAIDLGVQRAQYEHAIALLIGKPASDFSLPAAPLTAVPPPIPLGVPSTLLERRPDIAAAERRMAAANAQIGVAEAAWYPSITLSASGGLETTSFSRWFSWPSRFWSVGPAVSETLFDGGARSAQTEQARAAFDAEVATYRQTVLTGFQEVEDNLAALRILEKEATVQDEAVQAARQSVIVAENQYKAGITSYLTVLTAQTAQLTNERTAIAIRGSRMTAGVLLIKALGGGWDASYLQKAD